MDNMQQQTTQKLNDLSVQIKALIRICDKLKAENASLLEQRQTWLSERSQLVEKNEIARAKIEAMIQQLKAIEHV